MAKGLSEVCMVSSSSLPEVPEPILGLNTNTFNDSSQLFKNENASIEEFVIKTDPIIAENSELCIRQSPSITDKKNYVCPYIGCTMEMRSKKEYMAHRKTHPKPFIYECKAFDCGRTFNHSSSLFNHKGKHGPKIRCEKCDKYFPNKAKMRLHRNRCNTECQQQIYECLYPACNVKTKYYNEYIIHKATHPKPFIYECRVHGCGRIFNHASSFSCHKEKHKPEIRCKKCGECFSNGAKLKRHKKSCSTEYHEKNYVCPYVGCTMETKNHNEYIAHRKTHPKPFIYECKVPGCGLTFNQQSLFSRHQEKHRPKPKCGNCGNVFSCKNYLETHKKCCIATSL
ncbi:Uncharacterized protein BM_BM17364 [Brugia malayi]|uniref:C2H2-type domain-containing protein n=1 Tax=Brugia malayi TaxID=6279 RepID=A0A4E9F1V2_BRUMA|nr:Uncharacterized protein BM_BM17364 [Brugia malayi]VIO90741.1 Uncharacterized protein BM_BM17364 [Brugia malayi]